MSNTWILLKVQLLSLFGINKTIHSNDRKEKDKMILMVIAGIIGIAAFSIYSLVFSLMLSQGFKVLNIMDLLPAIMMISSSAIILITTIIKSNGLLFSTKDYDMIISLPVKTSSIVASKILTMYIINFALVLLLMLPAGIIYAIIEIPSIYYYLVFILTLFMIPLIPMIIATFLGALIVIISSRFKYKNIVSIILTFILMISIIIISFNGEKIEDNISDISKTIISFVYKIYPIAKLYVEGLCSQNIIYLILFSIISIGTFVLFVKLISINYIDTNNRLSSIKSKSNYKLTDMKISSPFKTLYIKEIKRYFSSTIYVVNTSVGMVFLVIVSILLCIFSPEKIEEVLSVPGIVENIKCYAPLVASCFIFLSCTTSCSISLEGKNIWIIKSLPVKAKDIFLSKIIVNMTVLIPVIIFSGLIFIVKLDLNIIYSILMFITPITIGFFISMIGLIINLKFPNLDWTNEVTPIKQSMSTFITLIVGMLSIFISIGFILLLGNINKYLAISIYTSIVATIDFILYRYLYIKGEKLISSL